MRDVKLTLLLTVGLVVLVIFLFLRNISATIIPSLALPGSIVATFAVMYLLGYSLDNLSLMALTLSVGFVVDDAIVMLENIVRHMEMGKPPMQAALDGSKEIAFTIVAMTLSLTAVFIPVLFMGGIVGRLLHEFAVTIGVAILVSGFVSISLTPMLCSRFLKPPHAQRHGCVLQRDRADVRRAGCASTTARCALTLRFRAVDDGRLDRAAGRARCYLFMLRAEGLPAERRPGPLQRQHRSDSGHRVRRHGAPPARGGRRSSSKDPNVAGFTSNVGQAGRRRRRINTGRMNIDLKPRDQRDADGRSGHRAAPAEAGADSRLRVFMTNQPPINLGGRQGARSLYQFTLQDTDTGGAVRMGADARNEDARAARHSRTSAAICS